MCFDKWQIRLRWASINMCFDKWQIRLRWAPLNNPSGFGPDYTLTCYGQVLQSQNCASACTVSSTDRGDIVKNVWKKLKSRNYITIIYFNQLEAKDVQISIFLLMPIYFCFKKFFDFCFCSAYLSSCHQIASDAKCWTIRALFTSGLSKG